MTRVALDVDAAVRALGQLDLARDGMARAGGEMLRPHLGFFPPHVLARLVVDQAGVGGGLKAGSAAVQHERRGLALRIAGFQLADGSPVDPRAVEVLRDEPWLAEVVAGLDRAGLADSLDALALVLTAAHYSARHGTRTFVRSHKAAARGMTRLGAILRRDGYWRKLPTNPSRKALRALRPWLRGAGRIASGLSLVVKAADALTGPEHQRVDRLGETVSEAGGAALGAAGGAKVGAVAGFVIGGPLGAAVFAGMGAVAGGIAGGEGGRFVWRARESMWNGAKGLWRKVF